jgi:uncharacterized protein (DUF305 family)
MNEDQEVNLMKDLKNQKPLTRDEVTYLNGMIEHHQMALVMAKDVLKVSRDNDIMSLSFAILQTQMNEIALMKQMLKERS